MPRKKLSLMTALAALLLGGAAEAAPAFELSAQSAAAGSELALRVRISLRPDQYVYAADSAAGWPTALTLKDAAGLEPIGALTAPDPETKDVKGFGQVTIHHGDVVFTQRYRITGAPGPRTLKGNLSYQVCDADTCLLEETPFALAFEVTGPPKAAPAPEAVTLSREKVSVTLRPAAAAAQVGRPLDLIIDFEIAPGSYIYAPSTGVAMQRTRLSLEEGGPFKIEGAMKEPAPKAKKTEYFGEVLIHEGKVRLRQAVTPTGPPGAVTLKGRLDFQLCDESTCLNDALDFAFPIRALPAGAIQDPAGPATAELGPLRKRIEAVEEGIGALRDEVKRSRGAIVDDVKKALEDLRANLAADKKGGQKYDQILSYHHDDWEGALAAARKSGKQLFADFTGYFCQNCRMMESTVLVNPRIVKLLRGYERVVLHTDNPKDVAERERHRALLKKLGGAGPIPAYFIVDPKSEETIQALSGAASVEAFEEFLKQGSPKQELGWIGFILTCIGLGLLTVVMPCTYPMIPITISVFSKGDKASRGLAFARAGIYALGIIVSYTAIGGIVQLIFGSAGQQKIQDFANNGIVNLLIGGAFIYFAFSFFGFYEIAMPSFLRALMQKGQPTQDKSGAVPAWSLFLMGAFFMLTSYSCGAPFVLAVFEQASQQAHPLSVVLALFIFSATLAAPFLLLALLPGALKAMPRSGGWFTTFKVTLGFFELAFALKFLSTTDITYNLAFLTRPVFVGVWIVIMALAAFYLLGFLRFPHDMKQETVSQGRLIVALILLVLAVYLGSWFSGAKLNSNIEALMPPHPYPELVDKAD